MGKSKLILLFRTPVYLKTATAGFRKYHSSDSTARKPILFRKYVSRSSMRKFARFHDKIQQTPLHQFGAYMDICLLTKYNIS